MHRTCTDTSLGSAKSFMQSGYNPKGLEIAIPTFDLIEVLLSIYLHSVFQLSSMQEAGQTSNQCGKNCLLGSCGVKVFKEIFAFSF